MTPLTPRENFSEAHVAAILLTTLHQTALTNISSGGPASGELAAADPGVYAVVQDAFVNGNAAPVVAGLQQLIASLTMKAADSADDPYSDNPDGCLSAGNLAIVQGLFQVKA